MKMNKRDTAQRIHTQGGACKGVLCADCFAYESVHCSDKLDLTPSMTNPGLRKLAADYLRMPKKTKQEHEPSAPKTKRNLNLPEVSLFVDDRQRFAVGVVDHIIGNRIYRQGDLHPYVRCITLFDKSEVQKVASQLVDSLL